MHIYHFYNDSPIAKIEFSQDNQKLWSARIFPRGNAAPETLVALNGNLNTQRDGILSVAQSEKGVHTLFVSGFETPEKMLKRLENFGYAHGKPTLEITSEEADKYSARIREASLKWAGIFYLISDAAIAAAGIAKGPKHYGETIAGALYAVGGVIMAKYGHKNSHTHLQDISLQLGDFFTQEGIPISKDSTIIGANNERKHSVVEGLERFAYTYPSQIFNSFVAVCGYNLLKSGLLNKNNGTSVSGALVMGGALAGLLIPEKSNKVKMLRPGEKEKVKQPPGMFDRISNWVQEKPLRVPGMLWFGNNIAMIFSALKERRENKVAKAAYRYKFSYVAAAMVANALMFISPKDQQREHFEGDSDSMQTLLAVAAGVIAAQPREMQDQIIEHTAGFLASQKGMSLPTKELAAAIREQVAELSANPFLKHGDQEASTPATEKQFASDGLKSDKERAVAHAAFTDYVAPSIAERAL